MRSVTGIGILFAARAHPSTPAAPQTPTELTSYRNAFELGDQTCSQTGYCDRFVFKWPANTTVHIELASEIDTFVIAETPEGEMTVKGSAEHPAIVEFVTYSEYSGRVLAAARSSVANGEYELKVGPAPTVVEVPAPASTLEQRKAEVLSRAPEDDGLKTSASVAANQIAYEISGYMRDGAPVKLPMSAAKETSAMSFEPGYCYRVVARPAAGAAYSAVARRGLEWRVNDRSSGALRFIGTTALSDRFCIAEPNTSKLSLRATYAPRGDSSGLGKGDLVVERLRDKQPLWPSLYSRADLDKVVRKITAGMGRERRISGRLESFKPTQWKLSRGRCYALVVTLHSGATWAPELASGDRLGIGSVRGPGAFSDIGCQIEDQMYDVITDKTLASLGTGGFDLELHSRAARGSELADIVKQEASSNGESARIKNEHCKKCREQAKGDSGALESCARQWYEANACY